MLLYGKINIENPDHEATMGAHIGYEFKIEKFAACVEMTIYLPKNTFPVISRVHIHEIPITWEKQYMEQCIRTILDCLQEEEIEIGDGKVKISNFNDINLHEGIEKVEAFINNLVEFWEGCK